MPWLESGVLHPQRCLSSLVLAEHRSGVLEASTAQTVAAARVLSGPISVLVAGHDLGTVPEQAAKLEGVSSVLIASDPSFKHLLAGPGAALLVAMQKKYVRHRLIIGKCR